MQQLAHCAALGIQEAIDWCEELDIPVQYVNPIGLVTKRQLQIWAATCVKEKAAYMDRVCTMLLSSDEHEQAVGQIYVNRLAESGDAMGLILYHVDEGIYASHILDRKRLAYDYVWPEVVAALQ